MRTIDFITILSGLFLLFFGIYSFKSGLKKERKKIWMFYAPWFKNDDHPFVNIIVGAISIFSGLLILGYYILRI